MIGVHKIGKMPQDIAKFLALPNPNEYTGHSFRRTSATFLVDAGGNMESLKRHGGWKSGNVAERYIDQSIQNTKTTAEMVTKNVLLPSTSRAKDFRNIETTELEDDAEESSHEIDFELPKKKSKSSETTVTSVSEPNFGRENTQSDEFLHQIQFQPPKKKFKSSETTVTSVSEQNFGLENTLHSENKSKLFVHYHLTIGFNNSLLFVQLFEFLRSETLKVNSSFHFFLQKHTAETIFFRFEMTYHSINFFV